MIPLLLLALLAQTPAQQGPVRGGSPTPDPGTTSASPAGTMRLDAPIQGALPCSLENGRNVAKLVFELDLAAPGFVTLTLESPDFDALLVARGASSGAEARDSQSWRRWDAWLVLEVTQRGKLLVEVSAEDDRGGEFTLAARAGRIPPPLGEPRVRDIIETCEKIAQRAEAKGDSERSARFLGTASRDAYAIEDFERARSLARRQLELAEAKGLRDEVLRARGNLGATERRLGNADRARELLGGAIEEVERIASTAEDPGRKAEFARLAAFLCDNLGDVARDRGGYAASLPLRRRALQHLADGRSPDFEAIAWGKLGDELGSLGQVAEAEKAVDKGLEIARRLKSAPILASALRSRARFLERYGSTEEARAECARALELSPPPAMRLDIEGTLVNALAGLGRYEDALELLGQVEVRAREIGLEAYEIPLRVTRARIAFDLWDLSRARALLEEALALQEASGSPLHRVDVLMMLGLVLDDLGAAEDARTRLAEALETCDRTGETAARARVLNDIGLLHERAGEFDKALPRYSEAEGAARAAESPKIEESARCGRAYSLFRMGNLAEAKPLAERVAASFESLGELRGAVDTHDTLARIGLATGDLAAVDDALCAADRLFGLQDEQHLDRFAAAGLRSRFADWGGIAQDLVARRARAESPSSPERDKLVLDGWRAAGRWKGRVLLESMRQVAGAGTTGETPLPWNGPRSAILEYVEGLENLYAYVVTASSMRLVDLGPRSPIEEKAREFARDVAGLETPPSKIHATGSWLHDRLATPVLDGLPPGTSSLVIVPTPGLSALPFEALVRGSTAADGEGARFDRLEYLLDRYCVTYAPSSPVLAELQGRAPRSGPPRFLVLGDPVYGDEADDRPPATELVALGRFASSSDYPRLKSTREEVLTIADILVLRDEEGARAERAFRLAEIRRARSGKLHGASFDLVLGADVARPALARDLREYSLLHIAAHGLVDPDDPRRSGLVLSYPPGGRGLFALEEVLDLKLDADLVVLSACDTARGAVVRGEGVHSLATGFLQAGARSVVASQWPVQDLDAAEVMKRFYALHLELGLSRPEALRQAKLDFRRSATSRGRNVYGRGVEPLMIASNPYYWAPFVYIGPGPE